MSDYGRYGCRPPRSLASSVPLSQASGVKCNGQSKGERERWVIDLLVSGYAVKLGQQV